MMTWKKVAAASLLATSQAWAAIEVTDDTQFVDDTAMPQQNLTLSNPYGKRVMPESFVPFLGIGMGYMDRSDRHETEGTPLNLKVLGSYYYQPAMLIGDIGVGIEHQSYSQDLNGKETTQAVVEMAGRYEFADRLSAGVILNALTGEGRKIGSSNDQAYFWGLQVVKEFSLREFNVDSIARVGARLSTDINIPGERVNVFMLEASMGLPNFEKRSPYVTKARPKVQQIVLRDLLKDPGNANFAVDSSEVVYSQQQYLNRLATALKANPGLVQEIYVVGHTDDTGTAQWNMDLSRRRAQEVARVLRSAGLSSQMIQTDWKGETLPINPMNRDENRRVEVKFIGVSDEAKLDGILRSL